VEKKCIGDQSIKSLRTLNY